VATELEIDLRRRSGVATGLEPPRSAEAFSGVIMFGLLLTIDPRRPQKRSGWLQDCSRLALPKRS